MQFGLAMFKYRVIYAAGTRLKQQWSFLFLLSPFATAARINLINSKHSTLKNKSSKQDRLLIESLSLSAEESVLCEDLVAASGVYRSLGELNGIITFQDDQSID